MNSTEEIQRAPVGYMSVEEYLAFEAATESRHEYVAGGAFVMADESIRHAMISQNISSAFHNPIRGGQCRVFSYSVKVHIKLNDDDLFYYPDVMVSCGPLSLDDQFLLSPKLIVEVLSPSTEAIDRREKAVNYRRIAALEEYVLVAQRAMEVTIYRRQDQWAPQVLKSREAVAELRSIELSLPLTRIYEYLEGVA